MNTHKSTHFAPALAAAAGLLLLSIPAAAEFTYQPPGELGAGSGTGRVDQTVYVEGMRFPIEDSPAYANSQVWGHGGNFGPGGGQCDENNYSYPWWDNFCEERTWDMPLCPAGQGHQGQDIRPGTCTDKAHWAVAAEDGTITSIGSYSVYLMTADGTQHRYLHMDPASVPVSTGDTVSRGDRLGLISNAFGGTPTTIHLHYDIQQNVAGEGFVYVPTYLSLVRSYQDLIGQPEEPCGFVDPTGAIIDNDDPCFYLLGNRGTWRTETAGYNDSLHWTYAYDGPQPDGYARWTLHFHQPGTYELEVYIDTDFADSEQARYSVRAGGIDQEVRLDQSASTGWHSLGEFTFAADDAEWLEVYDNTGEPLADGRRFVADALRLTNLDPDVDADTDADGDSNSDADADADGNSNADADADADADSDGNSNADADADGDSNADADTDPVDDDVPSSITTHSCSSTPGQIPTPLLLVVGLLFAIHRRLKADD